MITCVGKVKTAACLVEESCATCLLLVRKSITFLIEDSGTPSLGLETRYPLAGVDIVHGIRGPGGLNSWAHTLNSWVMEQEPGGGMDEWTRLQHWSLASRPLECALILFPFLLVLG